MPFFFWSVIVELERVLFMHARGYDKAESTPFGGCGT